jgi:PAS domain S-box-containing protein
VVVVFGHDVTEERRAKDFLLREQERFRGIMENATDGISLMGSDGRFVEWNPSMERITGIPRAQALESSHSDIQFLLTPSDERNENTRTDLAGKMRQYLDSGDAPWLDHLTHRWIERPDGTRRYIEMVSFRIQSSFDMLTGTVTRDLTEIEMTEEDLKEKNRLLAQQNEELRERNEELDTFTHSVAHDLKNPLSLILGYADMVQQEAASMSGKEVQEYMSSVMFNGRKMISIINSLLLLASVRKEDVEVVAIDMAQVAADAVRRLHKQIGNNASTITLPAEWHLPLGYAPWIEEVWVNYLGNAVKYGGKGCRVDVTVTRQADGMLRYTVTDDGPGVPADRLNELFIPFTRLAQAKIEGHGLGLSIVKRIIDKLGGEVGVYSEQGKGSSFWFTLPDAGEDR